MSLFLVEHVNFGTGRQFETFEEAKAWTIKQCFEASITLDGMHIADFHPIRGFRINPQYLMIWR